MKNIVLPLFIVVALAQWIVPGSIIWKREEVRNKGKAFRFKTEPVDPSHPFKGRYVALSFKEDRIEVPATAGVNFEYNQEVYAIIKNDDSGFARLQQVTIHRPATDIDYITASVYYTIENAENGNTVIQLRYPFDVFYMDEYKAPRAETVYRKSTIDSTKTTYALIKVWKGKSVLENVFIDGKPIGDLVE